MKRKISKEKKVWIFKWLLKKNRCLEVHLERGFFGTKENKKTEFCKVILDMDDGKRFTLGIDIRQENPKIDISQNSNKLPKVIYSNIIYSAFMIPFKYNFSYADVLDEIMKAMEKNDSDCWISDGWANKRVGPFLKRYSTLEGLSIEFDLSSRDVFNFKELKK